MSWKSFQGVEDRRECRFASLRLIETHEDREYLSYGRFVIEAESKRHDAVLALLTERDRRRIGVELGIIPNLDYALPTDTLYHLGTFASNQLDVPATPTFTSENGHSIWVIRDFKTHSL